MPQLPFRLLSLQKQLSATMAHSRWLQVMIPQSLNLRAQAMWVVLKLCVTRPSLLASLMSGPSIIRRTNQTLLRLLQILTRLSLCFVKFIWTRIFLATMCVAITIMWLQVIMWVPILMCNTRQPVPLREMVNMCLSTTLTVGIFHLIKTWR